MRGKDFESRFFKNAREFIFSFYFLLALCLVRASFESAYSGIEERGAFFFFKFWFYSFVLFLDYHIANLFGGKNFSFYSVSLPFAFFVPAIYLDRLFFTADFSGGIPPGLFFKSLFSFLFFARGIPKTSFYVFFIGKVIFGMFLGVGAGRRNILRFTAYFLISYFLWGVLNLSVIFGTANPIFFIFSERSAYLIMGAFLGCLVFAGLSFDFFVRTFSVSLKTFSLPYAVLIAVIGTFSVGEKDYILFVSSFVGILPFFLILYFIFMVAQLLGKDNVVGGFYILLFIILSLLGASRGIFVMFIPFFVLLSIMYFLPPFELRKTIFAPFFVALFSAFCVFIAHLSAKKTFSIPSEVLQISAIVFGFSFFDSLSDFVKFKKLKRFFSFLTCVFPSFFFANVENVAVGVFLGLLSLATQKKFFRFLAALYFSYQYAFLKYLVSRDIL